MTTTWLGDRALLRRIDDDDVASSNRRAFALYRAIETARFDEVVDVVLGARSVLVILAPGADPSDELIAALDVVPEPTLSSDAAEHEIVVAYGGEDGPDLTDVARAHQLNSSDVIRIHSEATYTVAFIGFSPGFPYLLGLDPRLATSRLDSPRVRVPEGSVGIGGSWTGIYPSATPGGWRLIGRTDAALFDPGRDPAVLLSPGDVVRFAPR